MKNDDSIRAGMALVPFDQELNRLTLRVTSPKAKAYRVTWGTESKTYTAEQVMAGIPLARDFIHHPLLPAFQAVWNAVAEKQAYETKQIKSIVHGKKGKNDPDAAFSETEPVRAALAEKVKNSLQPVEHETTMGGTMIFTLPGPLSFISSRAQTAPSLNSTVVLPVSS